jgi:hypothetical protein
MHAVALALVLVSGQSQDFYEDERPVEPSRVQEVRAGAGGATILTLDGVGAAGEAGLELKPWGPVALRVSVGSTLKVGWGTFFFAPELVYRFSDIHNTVSPYVALGANASLINITNQALGIDPIPTYRSATGAVGANDGKPDPSRDGGAEPTPSPVRFSLGPQATLGLRIQAFRRVGLDVGARWTMLTFHGKTYSNVGAVVSICAPEK